MLLERNERGGLLRNANLVENYPGFPGGIKGPDLVEKFSDQLSMLDIRETKADVSLVIKSRGGFTVKSDAGDFPARAVIVAAGTRPKRMKIKGSAPLLGRKVFSELVQMPSDQLGRKRVAVIGGGDAAFDYGLSLHGRGADVTIVSRSEPKCLSLLLARAETSGIEVLVGISPESVKEVGQRVILKCRRAKDRLELEADYVLLACGREPNIEMLSPALKRSVGRLSDIPRTKVPGLFLAGDIVRGRHRQTGIAVGDGIHAAMLAEEYLVQGGCQK